MTEEAVKEPVIGVVTDPNNGEIFFSLQKDCQLKVKMEAKESPRLTLIMGEGTAKELLILLTSVYGMEPHEVTVRFTEQQYQFLKNLGSVQEMTVEDVLRDIVQTFIDR